MLAMSPSPAQFSEFVWALDHDDPMRHQRNSSINNSTATMGRSESLVFDYGQDQWSAGTAEADHNSGTSSDPKTTKKLNHNANERDRRKRVNHLFSYLRSLLPPSHSTKKKSIPATITHVLNYIPELQGLVQRSMRRKEQLLLDISRQARDDFIMRPKPIKSGDNSSSASVSRLFNGDVSVQICTYKANGASLSVILTVLALHGLVLLNSSSFESTGGNLFHTLHFKVGEASSLECELLSEKIQSLLDKQ